MAKQKKVEKPCVVKTHFDCDGTGQMCDICGESETSCQCENPSLKNCKGCDGATKICVEHDAPCGDTGKNPRCDKRR